MSFQYLKQFFKVDCESCLWVFAPINPIPRGIARTFSITSIDMFSVLPDPCPAMSKISDARLCLTDACGFESLTLTSFISAKIKKPITQKPFTGFPFTGFPVYGISVERKTADGFSEGGSICFDVYCLRLLSVFNLNHEVSEELVRYGLKFDFRHFNGRVLFDIVLNIILNVHRA